MQKPTPRFCFILLLQMIVAVAILPNIVWAGSTGKILGRVTDASTGEPLPVAEIMLTHVWHGNQAIELPMPRGAVADMEGNFVLLNIKPGRYTVLVRMMGYEAKIIENVRVSVDRTTPMDVSLSETIIEGKTVTVTAQREAIKKDMTSSIKMVSSEDIANFKLESVGEVVALQPGVVAGHFRGGRGGEVKYLIDGVESGIGLHTDAIQEIQVISGTFNSEYGKVMSGIVNTVPKEGSGQIRFGAKLFTGNWLTNHYYVGLDKLDVLHRKELRFNLSGTVPFTKEKMTLFIFGNIVDDKGLYYGIKRYTMWDYTKVGAGIPEDEWIDIHSGDMSIVPMTQNSSASLMANLVWRAVKNLKVSLLYQYSNAHGQVGYNHAYKYLPERTNWYWRHDHNATLSLTHTLSPRAFHELKFMYNDHWSQTSRFKSPYDSRYVHDQYSTSMGGFVTGGNDKGFSFGDNNRAEVKYDLVWQINSHHEIKTGIDVVRREFSPHSFSLVNWYELFDKDKEYTHYRPYIPADTTTYADRYHKMPLEFSAYLQDKAEFQKLVINYGLRFDWFDPNTTYPTDLRNPANRIVGSRKTEYKTAKPQYQLSPRLGLSYQVADVAALHFSYGHFFQIPNYGHMYLNPNYEISTTNYASSIGNPNIKAEKTVKYELGLQLEVFTGMVLNTTVFYQDIYNLETVRPIETYDAIIFGYFVNKDYAMSKGVTVGLDYLASPISFNISYTLQYAEGNASSPFSNFYKAAGDIDPIKRFVPLDWDQRHTLKIAAGYNRANYGVSLIGGLGSGTRYTFSPIQESRLALANIPENGMTKPMTINLDLKGFYNLNFLKIGRMTPQLGFYIYNILDHRNEIVVFGDSGRAGSTIIRDEERASYISTFTNVEDAIYSPSRFSAPRSWKLELELMF